MTNLNRVRTTLTGMPGGPGVSTMYFVAIPSSLDLLAAFWATLAAAMPQDITIQTESAGDVIEDTTGAITGAWTSIPTIPKVGESNQFFAAPAGAIVSWDTATILDGRRIRGHTFVVPLAVNNYQDDGTLGQGTIDAFQSAANQLIAAFTDQLCIWHRPRAARAATAKLKALPAHLGGHALVTGAHVPDRVAVLRSRRN